MSEITLGLGWLVPMAKVVGVALARGAAGWIENSLEDNHISKLEYGKLGATVVRVGLVSGFTYWGVTEFLGIEVDAFATASSVFVLDWIVLKLKSKRIPEAPSKK